MSKMIKDLTSLRVIALLWLLVCGGVVSWADDTSSSGSNTEQEEVFEYDFANHPEIIAALSTSGTDINKPQYKHVNISVNSFQFTLHNCVRGNAGYLSLRTDITHEEDPAYVQGSMMGTMTKAVIEKRNTHKVNIRVIIEAQDGTKQEVNYRSQSKGTQTIDIPENQRVADAKSITIQADDDRLDVTKISIYRKAVTTDLSDPWILFKTLNADPSKVITFPTADNSADANEAYVGQIIQLQSNGIEGFDPVSTMSNPYVVTYNIGTTDESTPEAEFSNVMDGKKTYWKNGDDLDPSGNPIGKNGIVYRRGIVLGIDKDANGNLVYNQTGDIITLKVGIFRLTVNADGSTTAEVVKRFTKQFKLKKADDDEHEQPLWTANYNNASRLDIGFTPDTMMKTTPQDSKFDKSMTIMDPTQPVTVATTRYMNKGVTILAKFSKNDEYSVQTLLNAHNIHEGIDKELVNSTTLGLRKLTGMQYTKAGIASQTVAQGFYWYVPTPKQIFLEINDGTNGTVDIDITTGKDTDSKQLSLRAYYYDSNNAKQYVDLNDLSLSESCFSFGDKAVAQLEGGITIKATDNTTANFTVKGLDNGLTQMTVKTEKKLNANNMDYDTNTADAISYMAAQTSISINVSGGGNLMPPTISPYSQNYNKPFSATVQGYTPKDGEKVKFYYLLVAQNAAANMSLTSTQEADNQDLGNVDPMPLKDLREAVEGLEEMKADGTLSDTEKNQYPAFGMIDDDSSSANVNIPASFGAHYVLYAAAFKVDTNGKVSTKTETTGEGDAQTTQEVPVGSRVVWSDYIYDTLEAPVLTPGIEGENHFYSFSGTLKVEAEMQTANCLIFYKEGNDEFKFNVKADGTFDTNCYRYTSESGIQISQSTTIRAIAYNPSLGITSDIVTYRYALANDNIDNVIFDIKDINDATNITTVTSGGKYAQSLDGKHITLRATYFGANGDETEIGGDASNVNWDNDTYHIYYTTDGTFPTTNSLHYTSPILYSDLPEGNVQIHAIVYADGKDGDRSISDVSVMYLLSSKKDYWETTTGNCPGGVLTNKKQSITKNGETVVNIEFGGKDAEGHDLSWQHYASGEYGTGDPIDNVGYYTIAPATSTSSDVDMDADVKDEAGKLWNHSKANDGSANYQTHKATFGLPASGAYVKFEPKKSGKLTIWCCQEGALYYNNKSNQQDRFNEGFLRKRPAYFIDEAGMSIKPEEVQAAGVLSSNWNLAATQGSWNEKGETINGITQNLYTQEQTQFIYNLFNEKILANNGNWNDPIQPFIIYLHENTEENKKVAGFNVAEAPREEANTEANQPYVTDDNVDSTGVCLPSASYMKYTFDVKAGKTYFFFGWMTKIGIRGFGFEPSTEEALGNAPTIYSGKTGTASGGDSNNNDFSENKDKSYAEVTLQRNFEADKWTTLVLPFSVSASQVKEVFGDDTEILHYRTIEGTTMYFFKHYHQMIVAGTPILIKPSKEYKGTSYPKFTNVTFEKVETGEVTDKPCNDYGYIGADGKEMVNTNCQMVASYRPMNVYDGNYFVGTDGKVHLLKGAIGGSATLSGTNAYIIGKMDDGTQTSMTSMAKAAYNNLTPVDMDGEVTGISFIDADGNVSPIWGINGKIYNLNGQVVSEDAKSVNKLSKGVYIVNGKKVIVE